MDEFDTYDRVNNETRVSEESCPVELLTAYQDFICILPRFLEAFCETLAQTHPDTFKTEPWQRIAVLSFFLSLEIRKTEIQTIGKPKPRLQYLTNVATVLEALFEATMSRQEILPTLESMHRHYNPSQESR